MHMQLEARPTLGIFAHSIGYKIYCINDRNPSKNEMDDGNYNKNDVSFNIYASQNNVSGQQKNKTHLLLFQWGRTQGG